MIYNNSVCNLAKAIAQYAQSLDKPLDEAAIASLEIEVEALILEKLEQSQPSFDDLLKRVIRVKLPDASDAMVNDMANRMVVLMQVVQLPRRSPLRPSDTLGQFDED